MSTKGRLRPPFLLARHPACVDDVASISVGVEREAQALKVGFVLQGDLSRIALPEAGPVRRGDKLWQHTCFEIFVSERMPAYREFNLSPSGEWAAYSFRGYRQATAGNLEIQFLSVGKGADSVELEAKIPVPEATLAVAVSAVVESKSGVLSYWALKHPPGKPDFHHPESFVLKL